VGLPAQSPRMPLHLAAEGPRALAFAARLGDGWVTTAGTVVDDEEWWTKVGDLSRRLDDACVEIGRDPGSIARTLLLDSDPRYSLSSVDAFEDAVGRASERGFTDVVAHWPREQGLYAGERSVLDEVASRLDGLR
jgi:alkanesulfonate monooxygenase SsuD/methylene tetrahydromethanopterin reductase-like flavin-dependent oxidoreductase (luciferase family)